MSRSPNQFSNTARLLAQVIFNLILLACFAQASLAQEQSAENFVEPGYESLFNGKDLTGWNYLPTTEQQKKSRAGWQKNNPNAPPWPIVENTVDFSGKVKSDDGRFVVEDENLVITVPAKGRKVQMLYTNREFSGDFILKLEFRAANNADSGVFIRGKQLQCRDYPNAGPYKDLKNFKPGDWNELMIVVSGNTARCTCNGEMLEESFKVPEKGPIGVEGDRGKIEYRRIRIADGKLKPTNKTAAWTFEQFESGKGSMNTERDAITFVTTAVGDENWHVQAYQAGLEFEEGATYKITFEIKSSASNTVILVAQINEEDWHEIGLHEEIHTSKEFEKCEFTFTAADVVKYKNRLGFIFGEEIGSITVKNLKLEKQ